MTISKSAAIALLLGALMLTSCAYDEFGKRRELTPDERTALAIMLIL